MGLIILRVGSIRSLPIVSTMNSGDSVTAVTLRLRRAFKWKRWIHSPRLFQNFYRVIYPLRTGKSLSYSLRNSSHTKKSHRYCAVVCRPAVPGWRERKKDVKRACLRRSGKVLLRHSRNSPVERQYTGESYVSPVYCRSAFIMMKELKKG